MTQRHPLPAFMRAAEVYSRDKSVPSLAALAVASAEWSFTARGLNAGRELLARMPYNSDAVEWSDANFDHTYNAAWWPTEIPVLRLWGEDDRIVSELGWGASTYGMPNVIERPIADAGHFPWIDNSEAVARAFRGFVQALRAPDAYTQPAPTGPA